MIQALQAEIIERKRVEERLREYEKVVEGLNEMIVVVDREYRYVLANQAFLDYRGMQREQVVGHLIPEVLGKEVFETIVKKELDECFKGKVVSYEMQFTYPKLGEETWFCPTFRLRDRTVLIGQLAYYRMSPNAIKRK